MATAISVSLSRFADHNTSPVGGVIRCPLYGTFGVITREYEETVTVHLFVRDSFPPDALFSKNKKYNYDVLLYDSHPAIARLFAR